MKIAVVGAGIFGCITALKLREKFPKAKIHLFERNAEICREASGINQYRLHEGYHYPRSAETVDQCKSGIESFLKEYHRCTVQQTRNHYCIPFKDSLISGAQYIQFLSNSKLPFYIPNKVECIKERKMDLCIWANETLLNLPKFKFELLNRLNESKIDLHFNRSFEKEMMGEYTIVINCTYSNLNYLLNEDEQIDYQFELCEKPVVELDHRFKQKSFVIMDGPFMCIDPLAETGLHVMGHVKHAIHHTNVGKFPEIPSQFDELMNIGICNPKVTNFDKFVQCGKEFFTDFNPKHIGSMYTIRTVLPNREHDDARPSYVTRHHKRSYSIFSGKISTAIDIANELMKFL